MCGEYDNYPVLYQQTFITIIINLIICLQWGCHLPSHAVITPSTRSLQHVANLCKCHRWWWLWEGKNPHRRGRRHTKPLKGHPLLLHNQVGATKLIWILIWGSFHPGIPNYKKLNIHRNGIMDCGRARTWIMNVFLCVSVVMFIATTGWSERQRRWGWPGGQDRTISNCFPLMAIPVDLWILMLDCYELVGDPVAGWWFIWLYLRGCSEAEWNAVCAVHAPGGVSGMLSLI